MAWVGLEGCSGNLGHARLYDGGGDRDGVAIISLEVIESGYCRMTEHLLMVSRERVLVGFVYTPSGVTNYGFTVLLFSFSFLSCWLSICYFPSYFTLKI